MDGERSSLVKEIFRLHSAVLNSKDWGVPQNRERVFTLGHLRTRGGRKILPIGGTDKQADSSIKVIGRLDLPGKDQCNRVYSADHISPSLTTMQGGRQEPKIVIPCLTPDRIEKRQNGRRFKEDGEPMFTLTAQDRHGVTNGIRIRRLTPLECWRLQGIPDHYFDKAKAAGVSDSQLYKQAGNACTTNVIYEIARRLKKSE